MEKIYAQMYSLLRTSKDGLLEALKTISDIGYEGIEGMGTNTGGLSVSEFKKYLSELNLDPISFHALRTEKEYEFAQAVGARFVDIRPPEELDTRDKIIIAANEMNEKGKIAAKYGLKVVMHNHSAEFRILKNEPNVRIYDLLLEYTDPELVSFELDCGWAEFAGIDSAGYIRKYAGRFPLLHIKECSRLAATDDELKHFPKAVLELGPPSENNATPGKTGIYKGFSLFTEEQADILYNGRNWNVALGEGIVNWKNIKDAAEAQGIQGYVNEREYYHIGDANGDPAKCAKMDYNFLRSL